MWVKLPVEGEMVEEIEIFGNGKDCYLSIKTCNLEIPKILEMREPDVEVEVEGKIETRIFHNCSDTDLGIKYFSSISPKRMKLELCRIHYPASEEEWAQDLENFKNNEKRCPIGFTLYSAKIKLVCFEQKNEN